MGTMTPLLFGGMAAGAPGVASRLPGAPAPARTEFPAVTL